MYEEIATINNDMTLSDEDRETKLTNIYSHYSEMQKYYTQELTDLTNRGKEINQDYVSYNGQ
jgi:uncharacterized FlgJ-related protein